MFHRALAIAVVGVSAVVGVNVLAQGWARASPSVPLACAESAISFLRDHSPHGYQIYLDRGDPAYFVSEIRGCTDLAYGLSSAAHESVHTMYKAGTFGATHFYYLMDRSWARVPTDNPKLFPRKELLHELDLPRRQGDIYDQAYLFQNGDEDLSFILEELNAYVHDLWVATDLAPYSPGGPIGERDGLATFMLYLKLYLHRAQARHPEAWTSITRNPSYARTIQAMWHSAEVSLERACPLPRLGVSDHETLAAVYSEDRSQALTQLLGHSLQMPASCIH